MSQKPDLRGQLVLELFPGAGLFGKAFEALGATVVRGPDILWGGDVRDFHAIDVRGRFDGIIGGPPCQQFSKAAALGSRALNLIPEFVRVVEEARPRWAVMENVREAHLFAPKWATVNLCDWDCGGNTHRSRGFWFYGIPAPTSPAPRPGRAAYSVLASSWNSRVTTNGKFSGHSHMTPAQAAALQGYPGLGERISEAQPGWKSETGGGWKGVSQKSRDIIAVHVLGNGVPRAMGMFIAQHVAYALRQMSLFELVGEATGTG